MIKLNHILCLIIATVFICCSEEKNNNHKQKDITEKCPCDSVGRMKQKDKDVVQCFLKKSMIEITNISADSSGDTLAVCRYVRIDGINKWRVQEMIWVINEKLLPEANKCFYCDFKDESDGYRITFIRDEVATATEDYPVVEGIIGGAAIIGKDTIHSKSISVLIPKEKFKGVIQLDKIMNAVYKGKRDVFTGHMLIEAENMIIYGDLLGQYKAINKFCLKK